jgi:hypothetical protein
MQLKGRGDEPLLSVDDRCGPMLRAHRGHGRRGDVARSLRAMVTSSAGGRGSSSVTAGLVGKLTVGRVKCRVGQGGMTLWLEGSAVCWSVGVGVAGRVGRPNADLWDLAWERVS